MDWEIGRQKTGYLKKRLVESNFLKFDIYLIKYPVKSEIPEHVDEISDEYEHHRLNIILKKPKLGGEFYLNGIKQKRRINKFRPDIQKHSVTKILKGSRYVLSIGWLKRKG